MTKNVDPDKYSYSGHGISFYIRGIFSLSSNDRFGKNVIIFDVDISAPARIDNKKKDILILEKAPTSNTTLTTESEYSINFTEQGRKICLCLHYNGSNIYLFVNGVKISLKQNNLNYLIMRNI